MTAQKGRDLLLKIDPDATGAFVTLGGLRAVQATFNAQSVDATHLDSPGRWRELLEGAGTRSAGFSGSGLFLAGAPAETLRAASFGGHIRPWRVVLPGLGILEGPFQITSLEYAGDHDGAVRYDVSLASAGEVTFTSE